MQPSVIRVGAKAPPTMRLTKWRNPTKRVQRVPYVQDGQRYMAEIAPGETIELSSMLDDHIQRVLCNDEECRKSHYRFCLKGHGGQVVGGVAPMLERIGVELTVSPGIDPDKAEKDAAAAALAKAALAKQAIEQTMHMAAAKAAGIDVEQDKADKGADKPPKKLPPSLA